MESSFHHLRSEDRVRACRNTLRRFYAVDPPPKKMSLRLIAALRFAGIAQADPDDFEDIRRWSAQRAKRRPVRNMWSRAFMSAIGNSWSFSRRRASVRAFALRSRPE